MKRPLAVRLFSNLMAVPSVGRSHSIPNHASTDKIIEVAYVLKYAFCKPVKDKMDPWAIRQTAVYQKYDTETNRSTWIFFNPTMDCAFQERLMTLLRSPSQVLALKRQPLLIHNILLGTFFPLWRDYLAHYERKILTIVRCISQESDLYSRLTFRRPTQIWPNASKRSCE